MSYQQNFGVYDPNQAGVIPSPGQDGVNGLHASGNMDMPPPPPEEGEMGAGYSAEGYPPGPPSDDIEDPFGLPPPPESLLNSLIFDEPDSPSNISRDPQTQNLKAGSFAKIIERLTHPTVHDANFLYDFVLTYRSFAAPEEVLEALIRRYETAQEDMKKAIGLRVFNVLKHWIEKAWHDFDKDAALPERCMDFLDRCISSNDPLKGVASGIRQNLLRKKSGDEATITKASTNPPPVLLGARDSALSNLMDLNAEEIARQLTLIEWDIWVKIQPWECLGLSWTKKNKETAAPNVLALINRFNVVSGWVATTICTLESVKKRTKAIGKFLEISGHLMAMGNVNGVMEVVSGLGRGAVFRLKQTWEGLTSQQRKTYEEVKKLTDRSLSYANLRAAVKKLNPPCIPYLGMYLTDLTFIEEGNKDFLTEYNLINWNKRHLISETIRQIRQYQLQAYINSPVPWLQANLCSVSVLSEDELYELSEWLEVRMGKERGPKPQILIKFQEAQEKAAAAYAASLNPTSSASSSSGAGAGSSGVSGTIGRNSTMAAQFKAGGDNVVLETGHHWPFYEPDSPSNVDVDQMTNTVRSGTLLKIVERLTHNSVNPDSNALFGFLVMYRSFSNANDIWELLVQRWNVPPPKDKSNQANYNDLMLKPIQLRVFNFIKTWVDRHFSDFESNTDLKNKLKNFVAGPLKDSNEGYARVLTTTIAKQEALQGGASAAVSGTPEPPQSLLPAAHITNPTFLDLNTEEFARQLTLVHHRAFVAIKCDELLDQMYRSLEKDSKAKHVVLLQALFHYLFTFTKNELLASDQQGNAGLVATRLLEIAARLNAHRNLFGARAVVEGVDHVLRTKTTILDNVTVDAKNTFSELKDALIVKATTRLSIAPPMVLALQPFFNEISAAEMGIGQPLPDKRINFEKRLIVAETLVRLINYQKLTYNFHEVPLFTQWFLAHKCISPAALLANGAPVGGPIAGVGQNFSPSVSGLTASPSSSYIPRASNAAAGTGSGSNSLGSFAEGGAASTFGFFMMDLVLHDDEIKHEIQDMATEIYRMNVALIQDEIRQLMAGTKNPGQKLLFPMLPAPKGPMPVYVPPQAPVTAPLPATSAPFGNALGQTGAPATPTTMSGSLNSLPALGSTPPPGSHGTFMLGGTPGAPGSGLLPPANFGNPHVAKLNAPSNPNLHASSGTNPALGPSTVASNPALVASNPALNPALAASGSHPTLAASGSHPTLAATNPALAKTPLGATPAVGSNPALATSSNPATPTTPGNPTPASTAPTEIPVRPLPPAMGGKLPAGLKFPLPAGPGNSPVKVGVPPAAMLHSGSASSLPPAGPLPSLPPKMPLPGTPPRVVSGTFPSGLVQSPSGNSLVAAGPAPVGLQTPPQAANPALTTPSTTAATGPAGFSTPSSHPGLLSSNPGLAPPSGLNTPANPGLATPQQHKPLANPALLHTPNATLAPPASQFGGGGGGGVSGGTSPAISPSPSPVPQNPTTPPPPQSPSPSPGPGMMTADMVQSPSNQALNTSGGSVGSEVGPDGKKSLPMPAFPKSRQSFTSASKQASIRDLMAGLGKMSPSASNPALRSSNPLSGSGSISIPAANGGNGSVGGGSSSTGPIPDMAGTPPGTPGNHSRSNSNSSVGSGMTSSFGANSFGTFTAGPLQHVNGGGVNGGGVNGGGVSGAASTAPIPSVTGLKTSNPSNPIVSSSSPSSPSPAMLAATQHQHSPAPVATPVAPVAVESSADQIVSKLRSVSSQQLAIDFPNAQLIQWSAVEPGTNETLSTDLLKTDRAQYVCSIAPVISVNDINSLVRVGKLFKQQNPTLPLACIVLTFQIDATANDLAARYKMKVYQFTQ
jgi:hypothetical protein